MPAPGEWIPDRRPLWAHSPFGGLWSLNAQGLDPAWVSNPAARIEKMRRAAAGVTDRFMIHMPQGSLENKIYAVPVSDTLPTAVKALFGIGGAFRRLPEERWCVYTGAAMPKSGGSVVEDLNSQDTGTAGSETNATASNATFVADCVRFWGAKGFDMLGMDATSNSADDPMMEAVQAVFRARGQFPRPIMGEAVPATYLGGSVANNRPDMSLIVRRPWYMLERNFLRNRDPYRLWRFDPNTTEIHVQIDNGIEQEFDGIPGFNASNGPAYLDSIADRGMIVANGEGSPEWANAWWRRRYKAPDRLPNWARRLRKREVAI
jgi:hypothetical protein